MVQMLPYIFPLILGRTFNLDKMEVGLDIFPTEVTQNPIIFESPMTENHYKVIDTTVESRDLLDVSGSFSLKVKCGVFKAGASGAYLTDTYNRENVVEIVVKSTYRTVTEQLAPDAEPHSLWRTYGAALGTHFVRSITYGGDLLASVRMECNNTRDRQRIKAAVDVGGKIGVFDLGLDVAGEYSKDISNSVESTKIKIFSSIPLTVPPNDMKTLKETLNKFPEDLKFFNKGKGVPIQVELWPLTMLEASKTEKLRNRVLEAHLDSFEQKFDDLLNTKIAIKDWMKLVTQSLTPEQETKIDELYSDVQRVLRPFYEVIGELDMTKNIDQLKPAEDAYSASIPGVYFKKYRSLRQKISGDQGEWTLRRGNGATYVHWGMDNCSHIAEKMSNGSVFGPSGYGGGTNFMCLTQDRLGNTTQKTTAGVQDASYRYPNGKSKSMSCSNCRLSSRGAIETFVGTNKCPTGWDTLYDGVLLSGTGASIATQFVCLDRHSEGREMDTSKDSLLPDWATVEEGVAVEDKQLLVVCVVCAK